MSLLNEKLANLANLPPMPMLLMDALQQLNGKQDLTTLVDKISQDPSITVRILRVVNSPFYGVPREIGSLREAIILLGFNRIRDMLTSICLLKMLPTWHKDFDCNPFWHHSMAVAECARYLAIYADENADLAFTAGLLHDIGVIVIVLLFPDEFSQLVKLSPPFDSEDERQLLGFDHMAAGGRAAQHWNLPIAIQTAIEQHTTPPGVDTVKSLSLLIYAANLLITKAEQADNTSLEADTPLCAALTLLNVSTEQAHYCCDNGCRFADLFLVLA
jgi:putative nucleotidyltransferase with HDIG domain